MISKLYNLFILHLSLAWLPSLRRPQGRSPSQLLPVGRSPPRHPGLCLLPSLGLVEGSRERKDRQVGGEDQQRSPDRDSAGGSSCRTGKLPDQQLQVVRLLRCHPPAEPVPLSYSNNLSTLRHGPGSWEPVPASWNPHSVLGTTLSCNEQSISSR